MCKAFEGLPIFMDGTCTCKSTTDGTGIDANCITLVPIVDTQLGLHLDLEPCASPPYAKLDYSVDGKETTLGKFEAGKEYKLAVPGFTVGSYGGLFVNFEIKGDATDFTVHTSLSVCQNGKCDDQLPGIGLGLAAKAATAAGFPVKLLTFDDLSFVDSCPSNAGMFAGIGVGAVAVFALVFISIFAFLKFCKGSQAADVAKPAGVTMVTEAPTANEAASTADEAASTADAGDSQPADAAANKV